MDTIESSVWALLTTNSFQEAVGLIVGMGHDADSCACVTGMLVGALYGVNGIPVRWIGELTGEYPIRSGKMWNCVSFVTLADRLVELGENV